MIQEDIIQTILKDSNYHLSLFSEEEIAALRRKIIIKESKSKKTPFVACIIRWKKDYVELVEKIFSHVNPARLTLGEYRPSKGLASHISARFPESSLLKINSGLINDGSKLRYPDEHRLAMFNTIIDAIKKHDKKAKIALCKEDVKIWNALDMPINGLYCNCLG